VSPFSSLVVVAALLIAYELRRLVAAIIGKASIPSKAAPGPGIAVGTGQMYFWSDPNSIMLFLTAAASCSSVNESANVKVKKIELLTARPLGLMVPSGRTMPP